VLKKPVALDSLVAAVAAHCGKPAIV
jgi:hypothetical protein